VVKSVRRNITTYSSHGSRRCAMGRTSTTSASDAAPSTYACPPHAWRAASTAGSLPLMPGSSRARMISTRPYTPIR
jgi:hypothetical protein